ncbi:MAG: MBL fold metallo-hydrolase [Cyanobacteria bacterium P01_E01_bin.42]
MMASPTDNNSLELIFLNHASTILRDRSISLLFDPWFEGTCFKQGWGLKYHNPDSFEFASQCTHLWVSHFHGDHFHVPTLKKILALNPTIQILANDDANFSMVEAMKELGFKNITPLSARKVMQLGNRWQISRFPATGIDNMLLVEIDEIKVLNYNDCNLPLKTILGLKKYIGDIDILLNNFNHAGKLREYSLRQVREIKEGQRDTFSKVISAFVPQYIIPFASHHYYRDRLSWEQNESLLESYELGKASDRVIPLKIGEKLIYPSSNQKVTIETVSQNIQENPIIPCQPKVCEEEKLLAIARKYMQNLSLSFWGLPRLLPPLRIYFLDKQTILEISPSQKPNIQQGDKQTAHIATYSGYVQDWLETNYGTDGMEIGAHYEIANEEGIKILNWYILLGLLFDNRLTFNNIFKMLLTYKGILFFWHRREEIIRVLFGRKLVASRSRL